MAFGSPAECTCIEESHEIFRARRVEIDGARLLSRIWMNWSVDLVSLRIVDLFPVFWESVLSTTNVIAFLILAWMVLAWVGRHGPVDHVGESIKADCS